MTYEEWERKQYDLTEEQYRRWRKILYRSIREWPVEFVFYVASRIPVHNLRKLAAEWVKKHDDGLSIKELEEKVR